ncbi:PleD family two-component system response regulator [Acidobacteriota bacterium]
MGKEIILVADDDVQFVESIKILLESTGYAVFYTYRAKDVIDTARDVKPDLILLDVMFAGPPGPDGIKLSRLLHLDPILKDIPVIIISGIRKVMDLPFVYEPDEKWMPVKAFIEKPVRPDVLLSEINKVLRPKT